MKSSTGPNVQTQLGVQGMTCAACVGRVERTLRSIPGVDPESVSVNLATERASLAYDSGQVSPPALASALEAAGYPALTSEVTLNVGQLAATWGHRAEQALLGLPGVLEVSANPATNQVRVRFLVGVTEAATLQAALQSAGLSSAGSEAGLSLSDAQALAQQTEARRLKNDLTLATLFAVPLFVLAMAPMLWPPLHHLLETVMPTWAQNLLMLVLALPVQFWAGRRFYQHGLAAWRAGAPDMNTLVMLGTSAAFFYSALVTVAPRLFPAGSAHVYFEASAVVIALVLLGKSLEARAKGQSTAAMQSLLSLQVPTAYREELGQLREVAVSEVRPGDRLSVRPFERIPLDGTVVAGRSLVDESMLTGESVPASKLPGSEVTGGTINGAGLLTLEVTRVGNDTTLARIIALVERAQASRPPIQGLADRVVAVFVPAVLLISALTFLIWMYLGRADLAAALPQALMHAVAVLIIACPCAVGLATPVSIMIGSAKAAEMGVLFRSGAALEALQDVHIFALDKTGTLTAGQPRLVAIHPVPGQNEPYLLRICASAELGSEHPVAYALVRSARDQLYRLSLPQSARAIPGAGFEAQVDGMRVQLGNREYMERLGLSAGVALLPDPGPATAIYAVIDGSLQGLFIVEDPLKAGAVDAVHALQKGGGQLALVTGDRLSAAQAVARQLGFRQAADSVAAQVMPDEKARIVTELQRRGRVAFIGDGINDAPALAQADVGIAIGTGTDVAIETADVILMSGDLRGVPNAVALSKATLKNVRLNLFWAFAYNALLIPVAAGVLSPWGLALSPVLAAAAMALSSVFVLSNALRLRRFRAPYLLQ
ncbi:heavy metal translocating P-type ATPase [Deinococcus lacus]|uniref:Heavy metal translocating P-type ATPase n=1 Tax=Deinococcus lacus TaxID=392561 RepID=A0ABW1YH08_9DEIO